MPQLWNPIFSHLLRDYLTLNFLIDSHGGLKTALALEVILPEGGDIPQPLDDRGNVFDDVIHLLFCIVDGEAEADRTMGGSEGDPHSPEDMGWLEGTGSTG